MGEDGRNYYRKISDESITSNGSLDTGTTSDDAEMEKFNEIANAEDYEMRMTSLWCGYKVNNIKNPNFVYNNNIIRCTIIGGKLTSTGEKLFVMVTITSNRRYAQASVKTYEHFELLRENLVDEGLLFANGKFPPVKVLNGSDITQMEKELNIYLVHLFENLKASNDYINNFLNAFEIIT